MNLKNIQLKDILNYEQLNKLFKHFSIVSGLDVALYNKNGEEELVCRKIKSICNLVKNKTLCAETIKYGGEKAKELGESYIYQTACGLIMCSFPIVFNGELIGSISCGPVRLWDTEDFLEDDFYERLKKLGIEKEDFNLNLNDIKQLECVNMTSSAEMLSVLVNYLTNEEGKFLKQRLEISRLNAERQTAIAEFKLAEKESEFSKYPIKLEKELIAYVHLGDKQKAKEIINKFLNEIFSYASGNLDIIKVKLYEFTAFLSRAAVESGAGLEYLTSIVKKSSKFMLSNIDFQDLCFTTIEILDDFIDVVYNSRSKKSTNEHLAKAIEVINSNFAEDLSLDCLAKKVFVSSYYLSHLFREELNTTFSEYLTKVRIEQAKKLLKDKVSVEDVGYNIGFNDTNYFIKAFKKHVGITPAKYKKIME